MSELRLPSSEQQVYARRISGFLISTVERIRLLEEATAHRTQLIPKHQLTHIAPQAVGTNSDVHGPQQVIERFHTEVQSGIVAVNALLHDIGGLRVRVDALSPGSDDAPNADLVAVNGLMLTEEEQACIFSIRALRPPRTQGALSIGVDDIAHFLHPQS